MVKGSLFQLEYPNGFFYGWRDCAYFLLVFLLILVLFQIPEASALREDYWIRINLPATRLYLYYGEELQEEFLVAIGHKSSPTMVGTFSIMTKLKDPLWWPPYGGPPVYPGEENPLGSRWLGLNVRHYGIHGNNNPSLIGEAISLGCIRMYNEDIERIFPKLRRGSLVEIVYEAIVLEEGPLGYLGFFYFHDVYGFVEDPLFQIKELLKEKEKNRVYWPALIGRIQEGEFQYLPLEIHLVFAGMRERISGFREGEEIWIPLTALLEDEGEIMTWEGGQKMIQGRVYQEIGSLPHLGLSSILVDYGEILIILKDRTSLFPHGSFHGFME